jgi:hypothetical protein
MCPDHRVRSGSDSVHVLTRGHHAAAGNSGIYHSRPRDIDSETLRHYVKKQILFYLSPWGRDLHEKLTKEVPVFYETRKLILDFGVARPRVADGRDGLHVWMAANEYID